MKACPVSNHILREGKTEPDRSVREGMKSGPPFPELGGQAIGEEVTILGKYCASEKLT